MTDQEQQQLTVDELYAPLRSLDTGDILLYRTKDLGATFNAVMQGSLYSHISVVVCGNPVELNEMYPDDYKEDPPTSELAILEAVPTRGVTIFPLEARLTRSIGMIQTVVVRRHVGIITDKARTNLDEFMKQVLGRGLEIATLDMARSLWYNRLRGKYGGMNQEENWDQFFCSELVGEALQHLGIIREAGLNSNNLIPASFEERKNPTKDPGRTFHFAERITMPNHSYGPEEVLIRSGCPLKKELKKQKKLMKQQQRRKQQQQKRQIYTSQHTEEQGDSSESSSGEDQPWWQNATLDSLKANMSELKEATSQHLLKAERSVKKILNESSSHSRKKDHSQHTVDTCTSESHS